MTVQLHIVTDTTMQIKSNVRAGSQTQKRSSSTDSTSPDQTPVVISRCVGI